MRVSLEIEGFRRVKIIYSSGMRALSLVSISDFNIMYFCIFSMEPIPYCAFLLSLSVT